ncbi:MAG TPA: 30S ribosomal protein S7 [Dehalococcoidia bacterium]|jgi:small subunit ribosomal protein S7|nr:30S ribosomal protein S7 [Dehalococcoidia bacterium]
MSRRRRAEIRIIAPDSRFQSRIVSKFINNIMTRGKKTVAQRILYGAMDLIEEQTNTDPMQTFDQAMKNATPLVEVKPRRIGGATYQVPQELESNRSQALAMRWIISAARGRKGIPMKQGLANELLDASKGEGSAVRRRDELHRMAEANRAFVHFRR